MATHNPDAHHPFGGELGWVAGNPDHAGRGLGYVCCAAVVQRYLAAGYTRIYLKTDDFRIPAIRTYFKLGFVPFLYDTDMPGRWEAICSQIGRAFTPEDWPGK